MTDYVKAYNDKMHSGHARAHELVAWAVRDTYVVDGVIRWHLNDRVPPLEVLDLFDQTHTVVFDFSASYKALGEEIANIVTEYNEVTANKPEDQSVEEAFERRVVDIVTGVRYTA